VKTHLADMTEAEALERIARIVTLPEIARAFDCERRGDERPGVMAALKARMAAIRRGGGLER
jgi:hypothetical protein